MATMTTKRIAVSSFDVLECEIPIKWAQTNWFVSDFYTPHLMLRFHFFYSCSFGCPLTRSLSVIFYSASTNAHSLHTVLFLFLLLLLRLCLLVLLLVFSSLFFSVCSLTHSFFFSHRPWDRFSLFARYIFHIGLKEKEEEKEKKTHWTMVYCFVGYLMQTRYTIEKLNTLKTFSLVSIIIASKQASNAIAWAWTREEPKKRKMVERENGKRKDRYREMNETHRIMDSMEKIVLASKFVRC